MMFCVDEYIFIIVCIHLQVRTCPYTNAHAHTYSMQCIGNREGRSAATHDPHKDQSIDFLKLKRELLIISVEVTLYSLCTIRTVG